jgi:hypothetical protein
LASPRPAPTQTAEQAREGIMRKFIAVATTTVVAAGFLPIGTAKADVACSSPEKKLLDVITKNFDAGFDITNVDVGEAKLNYLQAQLACKEISKSAYCEAAMQLASKDVDQAFGEMVRDGTRAPLELISLEKELREIKSLCK